MSQRWTRVAGIVGTMALLACGEAPAQRHSTTETTHIINDHDGQRLEMRISGDVEIRDDDRGIARMGPGARLSIEESRRGQPERRVEFRGGEDGRVRTLYFEEGTSAAMDAGDRAWVERMILDAVRENGLGAERRVERIRRRDGVD